MDNKNKKSLSKKLAMVFAASLAALTGTAANVANNNSHNTEGKTIELKQSNKVKPMPVLKLNINQGQSKFVAQHTSHSSHSSHYSHSSHRSGGMFA